VDSVKHIGMDVHKSVISIAVLNSFGITKCELERTRIQLPEELGL
jgi:hypothetical protein